MIFWLQKELKQLIFQREILFEIYRNYAHFRGGCGTKEAANVSPLCELLPARELLIRRLMPHALYLSFWLRDGIAANAGGRTIDEDLSEIVASGCSD